MIREISVAEAKRTFSELMAKVVYGGDEFIIMKRGKPMVAVIKPELMKNIRASVRKSRPQGLLGIVGKFDDAGNFLEKVEATYSSRKTSMDRKVSL
jgi:prevent-host-death family protein